MRKIMNHIARNKRWYLIGCTVATLMCFFLPIYNSFPAFRLVFSVFTVGFPAVEYVACFTCFFMNSVLLILLLINKSPYFTFFNVSNLFVIISFLCWYYRGNFSFAIFSFSFYGLIIVTIFSYIFLFSKEKNVSLSKKDIITNLEKRIEELEKDKEQK